MRLFGYNIQIGRAKPEQRASGELAALIAAYGYDGADVEYSAGMTRERALQIPAVWAAVKTISQTLASLPFDLYEKTSTGAKYADRHPNYYITKHETSDYVTGYSFRQMLFADACFGNAYARIYRNGNGRVKALQRLNPDYVQVLTNNVGGWGYHVTTGRVNPNLNGTESQAETLLPYEVIHLKGITMDGLNGEEITDIFRDTFGVSISAVGFEKYFYANKASIGGILTTPNMLSDPDRKKIAEQFGGKYAGVKKTGSTAVLDNGLTYQKITLTPAEASTQEVQQFQVRQYARIFGMPLHLFQDLGDTTFNNVETMSTQFVTLCLRPFAVQTEQEFFIKTLTRDEKTQGKYFYRINLNGLLRGDTKTRAELYASGIANGWLTRNEARALEDFNTIEGLDKPLFPLNMAVVGSDGMPEGILDANADAGQSNTDTNEQAAANNGN